MKASTVRSLIGAAHARLAELIEDLDDKPDTNIAAELEYIENTLKRARQGLAE